MKNKTTRNNVDRKNDFRFEVANLITEVRYHYKITQAQLAKKMKTHQPSIARIESGNTLPSLSFLEKLAHSVGTYLIAPKFGFMEENVTQLVGVLISREHNEISGTFVERNNTLIESPYISVPNETKSSSPEPLKFNFA